MKDASTGISDPGLYDLAIDDYLADPVAGGSLSSSGAKKLLPPSCPALFRHQIGHPQAPSGVMTFGTAAHRLLLGKGSEIAVLDFPDRRTKAYKEELELAISEGLTPILSEQYATAVAMVEAARQHPLAGPLFLSDGVSEQVAVWRDERRPEVWRRALFDRVTRDRDGRLLIVDYKTTDCAEQSYFGRTVDRYGYHMQESWYIDAAKALGLDDDPAFIFVVQERTPPYLVATYQLDLTAHLIGEERNRRAIDIYAACMASNAWPGYADGVDFVSVPGWAIRSHDEEYH